nr:hypothetical protein [Salinispora arenicola]
MSTDLGATAVVVAIADDLTYEHFCARSGWNRNPVQFQRTVDLMVEQQVRYLVQ